MQAAVIRYHDAELTAWEQDNAWTVRLANLEARARYLDLALAKLLGDPREGHRAAARLLANLADLGDLQEPQTSDHQSTRSRTAQHRPTRRHWTRLPALGLRVLLFAIVSSTAFMLTTWLTTIL